MNIKLLDYKELKNFSPGAGIESFNEHLYLIGDEVKSILVMNRNWKIQETIDLLAADTFRKEEKLLSNVTASTIVSINKVPFLLISGSGADEADGNKAILVNLNTREFEEFDLTDYYNRLKEAGLAALNISGITSLGDKIVFGNGIKSKQAENTIVITDPEFFRNQLKSEIITLKLEFDDKAGKSMAISGMTYSYENDWLIFLVSSEDSVDAANNKNNGDTHIGVIEAASRKIGRRRFKINHYFNLSNVNRRLKGQREMSFCIQTDKKKKLKLHLVGRNDNGESFLFKLRLKA